MATRTKAITYFSCDLCGTDYDEDDLERLYGPKRVAGKRSSAIPNRSYRLACLRL
jgi:hypothetical protein